MKQGRKEELRTESVSAVSSESRRRWPSQPVVKQCLRVLVSVISPEMRYLWGSAGREGHPHTQPAGDREREREREREGEREGRESVPEDEEREDDSSDGIVGESALVEYHVVHKASRFIVVAYNLRTAAIGIGEVTA